MKYIGAFCYWLCYAARPHRSRTVRYAFPLIFLTAIALTAAVFDSEQSYVRLAVSSQTVAADERFSVDVYAYAHEAVNAVNISLVYPEDKVTVTGIDTGQSVITLWTEEPRAANGRITMSGGTYRRGFRGEHLVATINFQAKNTGVAAVSTAELQFLKGDGSGQALETVTGDDGEISLYIGNESEQATDIAATAELIVITDVDGDGIVTLRDVSAFMAGWFTGMTVYDFDGDGRMTFRDFSIILADSFFK